MTTLTAKNADKAKGRETGLESQSEEQDVELAGLLARLALRDRSAFSKLYDVAAPKLFGVCMRMLKDRQLAEDALQEVFVKIWRNAGGYRPSSQGSQAQGGMAWLVAIARNHSIDILRSRVSRGAGSHDPIDEVAELPSPGPNPEQAAISASTGRRIDNCMEELPEGRADAIRAAYVEGYSYDELAARHGVPLNTMRTWLRRGLAALRDCLER